MWPERTVLHAQQPAIFVPKRILTFLIFAESLKNFRLFILDVEATKIINLNSNFSNSQFNSEPFFCNSKFSQHLLRFHQPRK